MSLETPSLSESREWDSELNPKPSIGPLRYTLLQVSLADYSCRRVKTSLLSFSSTLHTPARVMLLGMFSDVDEKACWRLNWPSGLPEECSCAQGGSSFSNENARRTFRSDFGLWSSMDSFVNNICLWKNYGENSGLSESPLRPTCFFCYEFLLDASRDAL
jgi:hypothetical protein